MKYLTNKVLHGAVFFWWFPGAWILCAEVSEHSVCSTFIGLSYSHDLWRLDQTECSEKPAHKIRAPGNRPKGEYKILNKAKVWNQEKFYMSETLKHFSIHNVWYYYAVFCTYTVNAIQ